MPPATRSERLDAPAVPTLARPPRGDPSPSVRATDAPPRESPEAPSAEPMLTPGRAAMPRVDRGGEPATAAPVALAGVRTELGGVFYLLNAFLALELYGDFTAPRAANLALSPWDLLALIGRRWFGRAFVRDPVWRTLAGLAGRAAGTQPGRGFEPPPDWAVPERWLAPRGDGMPMLAPHRRRRAGRTPVARWLDRLLDGLEPRLALALDAEPTRVPELLCRHEARLRCTATEVAVHLRLDALPLAVRIAGLDRDTGWIPAAGRSVRFVFA